MNNIQDNGEILVQKRILLHCKEQNRQCHVFDVGANIGEWSRALVDCATEEGADFALHAFEPFPETYGMLATNLEKWAISSQVMTRNIALSSTEGEKDFYSLGAGVGANGFYEIKAGTSVNMEHQSSKVQMTTVDLYCEKEDISHIDLLKIDTEGHDLEVIYGCEKMLASGQIEAIQFEYNFRWVYAHHFLRDVFEFVEPFGLSLGKVTSQGIEFYEKWDAELESFREGNYLLATAAFRNSLPTIPWWGAS